MKNLKKGNKEFPYSPIPLFPYFLILLFLPLGCQKNINLLIPTAPSQVVIEGYIENGKHPYVMITRNAPFVGTIDSSQLAQYIVLNAIVTVSNGTFTDTLRLTIDPTLPVPIAYETTNMIGAVNTYYNLRVLADGKVLTATTKLTNVIKLDSLWFQVEGTLDSLGFTWARLTDPDSLGNCYRWFAKRIGKDSNFIPPPGSSFDDKFINGKTFNFGYNRGQNPGSNAIDDSNGEKGYFKKGETIAVKFCSIDRPSYNFWQSEETQINTNGNPFASPAPIISNINGGLGIWGAYAVFYDTTIAK